MKTGNLFRRFCGILGVLALALALPMLAEAKWSKACSSFSCDGVSVKVIDRHEWIGHPMDTYGYTEYRNGNDEWVKVNWRSYGVLKKGGKLVMCNDDSFYLAPKETRKEVYSYHGGLFGPRDMRSYVVSIEVIKGAMPPEPELVEPEASTEITDDETADEVYQRLSNSCKTKEDYDALLNWLFYTLHTKVGPIKSEIAQRARANQSSDDIRERNAEILQRWKLMLFNICALETEGRLNDEQIKRNEQLTEEIAKYSE